MIWFGEGSLRKGIQESLRIIMANETTKVSATD
jgi:hypothetical protein